MLVRDEPCLKRVICGFEVLIEAYDSRCLLNRSPLFSRIEQGGQVKIACGGREYEVISLGERTLIIM